MSLIQFAKSQVEVFAPLAVAQFSTHFPIELCCYIKSDLLQSVIYVFGVRFACLHPYLKDLTLATKKRESR